MFARAEIMRPRQRQRGVSRSSIFFSPTVRLVVFVPLLCATYLFSGHAGTSVLRVSNGHLQIGIDNASGTLVELIDQRSGHNHAGATNRAALWELAFSGIDSISPDHAGVFRGELLRDDAGLRLVWSEFTSPHARDLRVEVSVRLEPESPSSKWALSVFGIGQLELARAHFPRLLDLPRQENEMLAVPFWMGQSAANPRSFLSAPGTRGQRREWDYPGSLSLQCLAFYRTGGPGLYLACNDTAAYRKAFAFFGDGQGNVSTEIVHLPENRATPIREWTLPYEVVLGTFEGDWVTVAERYRAWGTNQAWAKESRLRRGLTPEWAAQTGLWIWNRGRSENVLAPALAMREKLGLPVNVFWHWWHGCSYDTDFPEYLPPREGAEPFKSALAGAQQRDVRALVYMNQRLWGMRTASWTNENAERFAVKASDGKIRPEVYNTFTKAPCVSMCMGTEFWRNKYAGLAESAINDLGVNGIYMDQACTSLACYDPAHGHPVGGGTYWMKGFQRLAADIRARTGSTRAPAALAGTRAAATRLSRGAPHVALAGEGLGEAWLPHLDLMLSLQVSRERYAAPDGWEPIPFFHAVYHPHVIIYGNYSSLTMPPYDDLWPAEFAPPEPLKLLDRKFSRQFYLEQARAFVWGQQPTLANFLPAHFEQRADEIQYVMQLAKLRSQVLKYLRDGTFLRPPELNAPETALDISRLSIYAGQQGGLTTFEKRSPPAIAGAWRAPDGNLAIALASIADERLALALNLDADYYALPRRTRIVRIDAHARASMGEWERADASVTIDLPPRGACVLEFSRR